MTELSRKTWTKVNDFLLSINGIHEPVKFNNAVLTEIREIIPYNGSGLIINLNNGLKPGISHSVQLEQKWKDSFNEYYYKISLRPSFEENIFSSNFINFKSYGKSEYFNDFIKPQNICSSAGFIIFNEDNKPEYTYIFNKLKEQGGFSDEELTVLKILRMHIGNCINTSNLIVRLLKMPVQLQELEIDAGLLSPRESEIIRLLLQRFKPSEIAKELKISILTVRKHIQNIYLKLNVMNKKELFIKMLKLQ